MKQQIFVAPMMDWTDRHCRYFMRLLSPSAFLYTEMVTANALHFGDHRTLLRFDESEHPIAIQLGGSDPDLMAEAAAKSAAAGYDEVNVNVGCPSDKVQSGQFGACLMSRPVVVAACVRAMQTEVDVPVTVKTRIGIDDNDSDAFLKRFIDTVAEAGCRKFIIHARIAILEGLSPKENRSVPPLNYERVYRVKEQNPEFDIIINGGISAIAHVDTALSHVDGVMIGRQAYHQPFFLAELEQHMNPDFVTPERRAIVERMIPYIKNELADGERLGRITRHLVGLYAGMPGAKGWRRYISEHSYRDGAGHEVVLEALDAIPVAA